MTYSVDLDLPKKGDGRAQLKRIRRHWEQSGYLIKSDEVDDDFAPMLTAERDGFGFWALAPSRDDRLNVFGDTPCVPPADTGA